MKSFAAANCQIASVRSLPPDLRLHLANRHRVADGQQTGEARSMLTRSLLSPRRQRYQFRCFNASTTIDSRGHMASDDAPNWTSSRSVSDRSIATVFRWPGAFGSQAVSVLGNDCCSSAVSKAVQSRHKVLMLRRGRFL